MSARGPSGRMVSQDEIERLRRRRALDPGFYLRDDPHEGFSRHSRPLGEARARRLRSIWWEEYNLPLAIVRVDPDGFETRVG